MLMLFLSTILFVYFTLVMHLLTHTHPGLSEELFLLLSRNTHEEDTGTHRQGVNSNNNL